MSSKWFEENVRPISPCVAQIKNGQSYPSKPNKAHTGDLSRFVGAILKETESATNLLCCTFGYISLIRFSWSV